MKNNLQNYKAIIFDLTNLDDVYQFDSLVLQHKNLTVIDEITAQLTDLIAIRQIGQAATELTMKDLILKHLNGVKLSKYGNWAYYPWRETIVHVLPEQEFIEVKTNRNQNKITKAQQQLLGTKKVGVIGLSVGQSVATTIVMERSVGEIRLADFDNLDLSNCNRIRTSVSNIGVPKAIITAREIAELDPYLKVKIYTEGITEANITDFLTAGGALDLVIEECDSLDIKVLTRIKAQEHKIPLIMEMSDRGMIDVERYDLQEDYKMFHGALEGLDLSPEVLKNMNPQEKFQLLAKMVDINSVSKKMLESLPQIGVTIKTWPQLASAVVLGGGVSADVARRILLNEFTQSGRYYVDVENLISDNS